MEISKGPEKKLKRGLQDISPLFQSTAPVITQNSQNISHVIASPPVLFDVQFVSVCVPDHAGDSFLANARLASEIVRRTDLSTHLVSIVPGVNALRVKSQAAFPAFEFLNPRIARLTLSHQELWSFSREGPMRLDSKNGIQPFLAFLEFEPAQFRSLARIAMLLDRVILYVLPDPMSLREAYRLVKNLWSYNPEIEYELLFRTKAPTQKQEEFLFERFSLIVSRFLGLCPDWLGDLPFQNKNDFPLDSSGNTMGFDPEPLLSAEGLQRPLSPEKSRFWLELQNRFRKRSFHER